MVSSNENAADFSADTPGDKVNKKNFLKEPSNVQTEMDKSLEMVHDFGANEMPYVENEGISPAPEGI